jgi:hypothetical protein
MAMYDAGIRQLDRERAEFVESCRVNAVVCIQRFTRWLLRRKRALQKVLWRAKLEATQDAMHNAVEEARLKKIAYRQALEQWYAQRKLENDRTRMFENQTAAEKAKIAQYRRKQKDADREERVRLRLLQAQEAEEKRIEDWIAQWDKEVIIRRERRFAQCQRAVSAPTTPAEIKIKKEIQKRVKKHIKVVLRKAGKAWMYTVYCNSFNYKVVFVF